MSRILWSRNNYVIYLYKINILYIIIIDISNVLKSISYIDVISNIFIVI